MESAELEKVTVLPGMEMSQAVVWDWQQERWC